MSDANLAHWSKSAAKCLDKEPRDSSSTAVTKKKLSLVQDSTGGQANEGRVVEEDAKESKNWQGLDQISWSSLQGICLERAAGNVICLIRIKGVFLRSSGKGQGGGGSSGWADTARIPAPKEKWGGAGMGFASREYPTGNPPLPWTSHPKVVSAKRQRQISAPRRANGKFKVAKQENHPRRK